MMIRDKNCLEKNWHKLEKNPYLCLGEGEEDRLELEKPLSLRLHSTFFLPVIYKNTNK